MATEQRFLAREEARELLLPGDTLECFLDRGHSYGEPIRLPRCMVWDAIEKYAPQAAGPVAMQQGYGICCVMDVGWKLFIKARIRP